jgi:hypothetical protein
MRAGPLSDNHVISLLNRYFVPVYVVNEDYAGNGPAPAEEKALKNRIFREGQAAGKSVGSVHVYLLGPDGALLESMHVAKAARTSELVSLLEKVAADLKTSPGSPAVPPVAQAARPECPAESIALHLTARSLDGRGAWSEFPVENWIVLDRSEAAQFLPSNNPNPGTEWEIDSALARKILGHFYPATENNDLAKNRFDKCSLKARVVEISGGKARARIEGDLEMGHSFYHKEDGRKVVAAVAGFVDFDPSAMRIHALKLVTTSATYGGGQFGIAVESRF